MTHVIVPVMLGEARCFVGQHHRHHPAPPGGLFAVGASGFLDNDCSRVVCGVAIVGRPVARRLEDGWTVEVTRCCTLGCPNTCSMLYAACWRAARALGYVRAITYTLATESGTSVRAAGWRCVGEAGGGSWNRAERPRVDRHPTQAKLRWEVSA